MTAIAVLLIFKYIFSLPFYYIMGCNAINIIFLLKDKICAYLWNDVWYYTLTVLKGTSQGTSPSNISEGFGEGRVKGRYVFSVRPILSPRRKICSLDCGKCICFSFTSAHPTPAANSSRSSNLYWVYVCWANFRSMALKLRTWRKYKLWRSDSYWKNSTSVISSQVAHMGVGSLSYTQDSAVYHQNQRGKGEPSFCCLRTSSCRRSLIKMCPPLYFILWKAGQCFS